MNMERLRPTIIEQEIKRPIEAPRPRVLQPYRQPDWELTDRQRLEKVREQLAGLSIINVITPEKQVGVVPLEDKTMGEGFMDLLLGFIGLTLTKTGEFMESFGEKK